MSQNQIYEAHLSRTDVGSPVIEIRPCNQNGRYASRRLVAAFIYELAAEFERKAHELPADWAISPEPLSARLVVELTSPVDYEAVSRVVDEVLGTMGLA